MKKYLAALMGAAGILAVASFGHAQAPTVGYSTGMSADQSGDAFAKGKATKKKVKKTRKAKKSRSMGMGMAKRARGMSGPPRPGGSDSKSGSADTESAFPKKKQ